MATDEPLLDLEDIQGNVFPGFNKDHQTLVLLTIEDVPQARLALRELARDISTSNVVRQYANLRAQVKAQRLGGPSGLTATWFNLSFGYSAIVKLASVEVADGLGAGAFKVGLAARSGLLGDAIRPGENGHPTTWTVGAPSSVPIDLVLTIAGDRREDVDAYVTSLMNRMVAYTGPSGAPALKRIVPDIQGDTLGGDLNGHEHFGFKDGISQPGLRGRMASSPDTFITPRIIDPSSDLAKYYGRPGQPLLWPGQFLLGQPRQGGFNSDPLDPLPLPADWLRNSSFMVLRILEQDVPSFWSAMRSYAKQTLGSADDASLAWIGSRIVGRWRSGAAVTRAPDADVPDLVSDDRTANCFGFRFPGVQPLLIREARPVKDFPVSSPDPDGTICPYAAHIRKVNPRDDSVEQGSSGDTLTRLILRRGIPYGPRVADPKKALPDGLSRGLLFVSYQASIERQFEFLMQNWVNGDHAPQFNGGRDAVLGRHVPQGDQARSNLRVFDKTGGMHSLPQTMDFITPRGGGYFLTPSMTALEKLTGVI
jgi:Dyp-type peroxidase family